MSRAALLLLPLLAACTSVTVREPVCEPPTVPAALLEPCEEPVPPADATLGAVYESYVRNVAGPWARCVRKDDQLIALVKYRDEVCAKIKADNMKPKRWWEF